MPKTSVGTTNSKHRFMLMNVKNNCSLLLFVISVSLLPLGISAQQAANPQQAKANYSQQELETFVEATESIQTIQQEFQTEMIAVIQEKGLTPVEFQKMAQAQQAGKETEMSEEKKKAFESAMQVVAQRQQKVNTKMQAALADHNMEMQEYQLMAMNINKSPELSQKVKTMLAQ